MTNDLPIHDHTALQINDFIRKPSHALILSGPRGSGKGSVARAIAAAVQNIEPARVADSQYIRVIVPDGPSIPVSAVRSLEHFLSLKVPGNIWRVAIIEDGHLMTAEAQNAILKTLEEPPARTTIILTATNEQALLPTVRSRAVHLPVRRPSKAVLQKYFTTQGFSESNITRAMLMSGGLPGLMHALLADEQDHPLIEAAKLAREIVQQSTYERLTLVDSLSKQKELTIDTLNMLIQMAHVALEKQSNLTWQRIIKRSYVAIDLLNASAQPKLVLTDLMLNM